MNASINVFVLYGEEHRMITGIDPSINIKPGGLCHVSQTCVRSSQDENCPPPGYKDNCPL